jgi:hypothetical protein
MEVYRIAGELHDAMKMKAHGRFGSHQDEWRDLRVDDSFVYHADAVDSHAMYDPSRTAQVHRRVCKGKKLPASPIIPPSLPFTAPQPQQ